MALSTCLDVRLRDNENSGTGDPTDVPLAESPGGSSVCHSLAGFAAVARLGQSANL